MSAVFEAAAMSLLSRTLTTALGKYLSNVDVEGLDWSGIRISKVELKAAKLMNLPGKPEPARNDSNNKACEENEIGGEDRSIQFVEDLQERGGPPRPPFVIETTPTADEDASTRKQYHRSWFSSWYSKSDDHDPLMDPSERSAAPSAMPETPIPSPSYCLELCEGGRLGILDIRLVGKALQILVEDADITLRVVAAGNASMPAENTAGKKQQQRATNTTPKQTTTGDRVLAENILAKILSGIPNLLLRDIRVKLILDETSTMECSIGLLSVTDGSIDILSHFGMDDMAEEGDDDDDEASASTDDDSVNASNEGAPNENQFLTKRIRTGRGHEGGVVVRVLVPQDKLPEDDEVSWARRVWYDSAVPDNCLARLSGLDLQGKIFLGSAAEIAKQDQYYNDKEAVVDVDELLFSGVDAIAPGPKPPLPPAPRITEPLLDETAPTIMSQYTTDENGIQSCKLASNFHRVARGLVPTACSCDQSPMDCECWSDDRFPLAEEDCHGLDENLPMAGLVLSISVRDPLEINVDRPSLETLGKVVSFFTKPAEESHHVEVGNESVDWAHSTAGYSDDLELMQSESMRSRHSLATQHSGEHRRATRRHLSNDSLRSMRRPRRPAPPKTFRDHPIDTAFPSYMQPEKIQFIGVCVAQSNFRVHVMRPSGFDDRGTSFCFWDCTAQRLAVDFQSLTAPERPFQDIRASLGVFRVVEYKGVEGIQTVLIGNSGVNSRDSDDSTAGTTATSQMDGNPLWPSTAAVLCNCQVLFDPQAAGLAALQARYLAVRNSETHFDHDHKAAIVHLGRTVLDTSLSIKDEILAIVTESRGSVLHFTRNSEATCQEKEQRRLSSLLYYKAKLQSGDVNLTPIVNTTLSRLIINGEISSRHGFSLETMLSGIKIKHGVKSQPRVLARGLTLKQLADLPETVRLRILLFIHDLRPLESALGLNSAKNSFLQCRAVNNGIVSLGKQLCTLKQNVPKPVAAPKTTERRQALIEELGQLYDNELEALLASRRGLYTL